MYGPARQYQNLLDDIERQLNRIKTEIAPEMGAEIQRHLNRILADVADTRYSKNKMFDED